MASIFDTAQSVLEVLRVDLHEWRNSPDLQDRVQRCVARSEAAARQATSSTHPAPPFSFHPLTTAPTTCVDFSNDPVVSTSAEANSRSASATAPSAQMSTKFQESSQAALPSQPSSVAQQRGKSTAVPPHSTDLSNAEGLTEVSGTSPHTLISTALPSRWASRLRLLSPAAQRLYVEMADRGQAALAQDSRDGATATSALWRRRIDGPRDAELRRAVRDFLYRMHILSCQTAATAAATAPRDASTADVVPAFADAVLNGTALCQLVATLLSNTEEARLPRRRTSSPPPSRPATSPAPTATADAVPCRCPRTLEEVRVNYAAALTALRSTPSAAQAHMGAAAWAIVPEDVFLRSAPTALLELFVHLISTYLPSPEELPAWKPQMCWQPAADLAALHPLFRASTTPARLAAAEADCCAFLHAHGILPDPVLYSLPGPECLLPSPLNAPFMASWKSYVARTDVPLCLLMPSIWPYVCNGVLLVVLARRCGAESAARRTQDNSVGTFFANPRTRACCLANLNSAFRCFHAVSTLTSSLSYFSTESAAAVLRGDRLHIVSLLLHLRVIVEGKASTMPALQPEKAATVGSAGGITTGGDNFSGASSLAASPSTSSAARTPATTKSKQAAGGSVEGTTPPSASTLRRLTPATIAKGVTRRYSLTSEVELRSSRSASTVSATHADPSALSAAVVDLRENSSAQRDDASRRSAAATASSPPSTSAVKVRSDSHGGGALLQWLCRLVGLDFRYTALDHPTCSFDARHAALSQPCFLFSDGVLLAHVIGLLECRRCDFLDCVQPAAKKAAKLFNVRRCLEFLRCSAGVEMDYPLLDEALVKGNVEGVVALLRSLRSHYGLAHKNTPTPGAANAPVAVAF